MSAILVVEHGCMLWLSNGGTWNVRHRLALVIGLLTFCLAFGTLKDCRSFTGRNLVSGAVQLCCCCVFNADFRGPKNN